MAKYPRIKWCANEKNQQNNIQKNKINNNNNKINDDDDHVCSYLCACMAAWSGPSWHYEKQNIFHLFGFSKISLSMRSSKWNSVLATLIAGQTIRSTKQWINKSKINMDTLMRSKRKWMVAKNIQKNNNLNCIKPRRTKQHYLQPQQPHTCIFINMDRESQAKGKTSCACGYWTRPHSFVPHFLHSPPARSLIPN